MIEYKTGDIFSTSMQTIVNTVGCDGIMYSGTSLSLKFLYPEMLKLYLDYCNRALIRSGNLWLYKTNNWWILNFPIKWEWDSPVNFEYIKLGLEKFVNTYKQKGITSIAFPILCKSKETYVISLMESYLGNLDIPVEIWKYYVDDDNPEFLIKKLRTIYTNDGLFSQALNNCNTIRQLLKYSGIGKITISKKLKNIFEGV